jgi:hypothetical protein
MKDIYTYGPLIAYYHILSHEAVQYNIERELRPRTECPADEIQQESREYQLVTEAREKG